MMMMKMIVMISIVSEDDDSVYIDHVPR